MSSQARPVAVVTGAGRSLGRAIAELLHGEGYALAVTDIDEAAAGAVATGLDGAGVTARAYALDVRSSAAVARPMPSNVTSGSPSTTPKRDRLKRRSPSISLLVE